MKLWLIYSSAPLPFTFVLWARIHPTSQFLCPLLFSYLRPWRDLNTHFSLGTFSASGMTAFHHVVCFSCLLDGFSFSPPFLSYDPLGPPSCKYLFNSWGFSFLYPHFILSNSCHGSWLYHLNMGDSHFFLSSNSISRMKSNLYI